MSADPSPLPFRPSPIRFDGATAELSGAVSTTLVRKVADLSGVYADEDAWSTAAAADPDVVAYHADLYFPVPEGTAGGLFFGNTFVAPGKIGDEYAITKGHFHEKRDAAEYYWCVAGRGALLLMDEQRNCRAERMEPGSLHYIPGRIAHRVANVGEETLVLGACWPSDAGHDYDTIAREGFSARMLEVNGQPTLVRTEPP